MVKYTIRNKFGRTVKVINTTSAPNAQLDRFLMNRTSKTAYEVFYDYGKNSGVKPGKYLLRGYK